MELFDSHAHYDDSRFEDDAYATIERVHESGVKYIINAGSDIETSKKSIEFAEKYDFVYAAAGIHPHEVGKIQDHDEEALRDLCKHPKVVAVGEIGLDYYYDHSPRDIQKEWLTRQIRMAKEFKLPVIIHDRDAHEDIMKIIKEEAPFEHSGVFHCFSGSVEMAKEVLKLGLYLSFGGALTFKNAKKSIEVVKNTPLEKILIETDCPYLTPEPFRGGRNDSSYVRLVADKIAELRGIASEEAACATLENAKKLFKID